jgi:hypothetical protein
MEMGGKRSWKLGIQESEESEIEEVILRVQGIVCNRELPPIRNPFKVYVLISKLSEPHTHTVADSPTDDHTYGSP